MAAKKDDNTYYCVGCGRIHPKGSFYVSENPLHANGRQIFCKDFIKKQSYKTNDKNDNDINLIGFKKILRQLDIPFLQETYESAISIGGDTIGNYFRMFNSLPQNRGLTWEHSDFTNKNTEEIKLDNDIEIEIDSEFEITPEIIIFWGSGFEKDEYHFLNDEFFQYTSAYECDSPAMEKLLQQAAYESLEIRKKREARQPVDKNLKNLQDLLGSANVKPNQETGANATDQTTFGTLIKKWENEKPIPDPLPEWKEKDIIHYVKVWFLGHLSKMVGLNNPFDKEYQKEIEKYTIQSPIDEDESGDE